MSDESPSSVKWSMQGSRLVNMSRALSPSWRYVITLLVIALAAILQLGLSNLLGAIVPFITFYPAVLLLAILGGVGPGLLALGLCTLVSPLVMHPVGGLYVHDRANLVSLAVFMGTSLLVLFLTEELRRAVASAEKANHHLIRGQEQMRLFI